MSPAGDAVALGLVCWLVTIIIVDSELLRPLRRHLRHWAALHAVLGAIRSGRSSDDPTQVVQGLLNGWRGRLSYLVTCHLCVGTWVGLVLALVAGGPFRVAGVGWILSGLLYKAIAHLVLAVQHVLEAVTSNLNGAPAAPRERLDRDELYRRVVRARWADRDAA